MQPRLDLSDSLILKVCCELELERGERGATLDADTVLREAEHEGVGREQAIESKELLNDEGYINAIYTNSEVPYVLTVTDAGFDAYGHAHVPDYDALIKAVGHRIVDHEERNSAEIADALTEHLVTVGHIICLFQARGFIQIRRDTGSLINISTVSPRLRRWLQAEERSAYAPLSSSNEEWKAIVASGEAASTMQGMASTTLPSALAYYLVHIDGEVLETTVVLPDENRRRNAFMVYSTVEKLVEYSRLSGDDLKGFNMQAFVTLDQVERFRDQHRDFYEFVLPDPELGQPTAIEPFDALPEVVRQLSSKTPVAPDEFKHATRVDDTPPQIRESLKEFREDHPDPATTAFIMMQFGKTDVHEEIADAIKQGLAARGITGVRADDREYHDELFPNILTYMHGCGLGVAVFERIEAERFNPNVALEVGYMYAMGKPVCLLKDYTLSALHADLIGKLFRQFDTYKPGETIPPELSKWLSDRRLPKR